MAELARAIPMNDLAHPLVDQVGESGGRRWSLTETRAAVVILDGWRLDLLRRCTEKDRQLVLATDETSGLTPAFVHAWREAGAHWLVRDSGGGLREGFTGRPLHDVGDLWAPDATDESDPTRIAVRHLRAPQTDAWELSAVVSIRMPARAASTLGSAVTELAASVGDVPGAWGTKEPALREWDVDAVTGVVSRRMPGPVRIVVRGRRTAAVVRVRRTRHGLEETTHVSLAAVGAGADLGPEAASRATDAIARVSGAAMPLVALVLAQRGRHDLLRRAFVRPPATPVALLVGPPMAKHLGLSPDAERGRAGAEPVGRPKLPGLLYRLSEDPDDPVDGWRALEQVLGGFDPARRAAVLGAVSASVELHRPPSF